MKVPIIYNMNNLKTSNNNNVPEKPVKKINNEPFTVDSYFQNKTYLR